MREVNQWKHNEGEINEKFEVRTVTKKTAETLTMLRNATARLKSHADLSVPQSKAPGRALERLTTHGLSRRSSQIK